MKGILFYNKNPEKLPNSDDFDCSLLTQPKPVPKVEPKPVPKVEPKVEPKPEPKPSFPAITYQQSIVNINGITFSIKKSFEEVMTTITILKQSGNRIAIDNGVKNGKLFNVKLCGETYYMKLDINLKRKNLVLQLISVIILNSYD